MANHTNKNDDNIRRIISRKDDLLGGFIKDFVRIEWIEHEKLWGYYPFYMITEEADGGKMVFAFSENWKVDKYYRLFAVSQEKKAKSIFMALDYPAMSLDLEHDFVGIFSYEDGKNNIMLLPYNRENGKLLDYVKNGDTLEKICSDFIDIASVIITKATINLNGNVYFT